jgi:Fimbrillin-like
MKKLLLFILLTTSILSCTNDFDTRFAEKFSKKDKPLNIFTKVLTTKSSIFMQEFNGGSVIGLHVISEKTGSVYDDNTDYKNVKAEAYIKKNKLNWYQTPEIHLNSEPAIVYAYYPYQEQANFDPEKVPVRISPDASLTTDYMYGTQLYGQKAINRISPIAIINMNHALAILGFKVRLKKGISGCYLLKAIQIGNKAGGTALCFRGKMNIKTGAISRCTGTNASTRLSLDSPRMLMANHTDVLQLMVIPSGRITHEGDVEVLFVIDGKTYNYNIPASTEWAKGNRYVYSLSFDGNKISLDGMETSEWLPVKNEKLTNTIP